MTSAKRFFLSRDPDTSYETFAFQDRGWPARWIAGPGHLLGENIPFVWLFRNRFHCDAAETVQIHLTADQRYDLFLDGERIGWGPERGLENNWFYESFELSLDPGDHVLAARVWWTGRGPLSACAHITMEAGFLLHASGPRSATLDTNAANWQAVLLPEYAFEPTHLLGLYQVVGGRTVLDASQRVPGRLLGEGDGWEPVRELRPALFRASGQDSDVPRLLVPAILPPMAERLLAPVPGKVRVATYLPDRLTDRLTDGPTDQPTDGKPAPASFDEAVEDLPVRLADSAAALAASFSALLQDTTPVDIPAHTSLRVIVDLDDYFCAFSQLRTSGGAGARITVAWAESLFLERRMGFAKGNRNDVDGKYFRGIRDTFLPSGRDHESFEPLWWSSGRYLQLQVTTAGAPLRLESFALRETHYPLDFQFRFGCDDPNWTATLPGLQRVLLCCMHESYMDCPYYEQLMYAGDTRIEVLETYAVTRDDRLPRKAQIIFDRSRSESGLTLSRAPACTHQVIPSYSLNWVQMVHDFAFWRDDPAFVRDRLDGVRSVLLSYYRHVDADGLMHAPKGWNFLDGTSDYYGAKRWHSGIPFSGETDQTNGTHNLLYIGVLRAAAELEELYGEPLFAQWDRALADRIQAAVVRTFYDPARHLFAEDPGHVEFAEHAQCLAILGGAVPEGELAALGDALAHDPSLTRTSLYFGFYLFEAFRALGRLADAYPRFQAWFDFPKLGVRAALEYPDSPHPTRSDCHAWSAHPTFHALASLAGIRPAAPGFQAVRIAPQPCGLHRIEAAVPHPAGGEISVDLTLENGAWRGRVSTPPGLPSTFSLAGVERTWNGGVLDLP